MSNKSTRDILFSYDFTQSFYCKYAVACAEIAMTYSKEQDPRSLAGIAMAKRVGNGENVPQQEREDAADAAADANANAANAADAAYSAADAAANAADAAANAAYSAADAAYSAANAAYSAANAAYSAAYAAANAAYSAAYSAADAAYSAADAAYSAANAAKRKELEEKLRLLLIDMIKQEFNEVELILVGIGL